MFTLIIGGSASGKSDFAERHVLSLDGSRIYIATMQPFGEEALARIARHHVLRRGRGFETIECYTDLHTVSVPPDSNVLLEDLGNLMANELFREDAGALPAANVLRGVRALQSKCAHLTIVTNEIFSDGRNYPEETLQYMRQLALVNRELAEEADQVLDVVCGLPRYLKSISASSGPGMRKGGSCEKPFADNERSVLSRSKTHRKGNPAMIFVTGPLYAGKQAYIQNLLGWGEAEFTERAARDVQEMAAQAAERAARDVQEITETESGVESAGAQEKREPVQPEAEGREKESLKRAKADREREALEALADKLAQKEVVIATEVGGGVIPIDPAERRAREAAGRLACMLADRADIVIRVCCGLPQRLK